MIAYLTDVEGRWDKLVSFTTNNPAVSLVDGQLQLSDGATFVFGGDAIDRGPHARRFVSLLLAAKRRYGERVVLLAGNRDINKTRLVTELGGKPHHRAPPISNRAELLRWTLINTMGAAKAFEHRATELRETGAKFDDDAVVESYVADLAPGGELRAYLMACQLAYRSGATLFVHGGITPENFLRGPNHEGEQSRDVDAWVAMLNQFCRDELDAFDRETRPDALIKYQSQGPDKLNQASVVYARPTDENGNPQLPARSIVERLLANGIERVVVGHTPSGDCPALVREGKFELVLADNSYGRVEHGSQVLLTDTTTEVRGVTKLDDGSQHDVRFASTRSEPSPLGLRDTKSGQLVKARLADGRYLLFRGLPQYVVEQVSDAAETVSQRALAAAR
ncbi:MAG: metallophosphoesterase [Archangium sp.]